MDKISGAISRYLVDYCHNAGNSPNIIYTVTTSYSLEAIRMWELAATNSVCITLVKPVLIYVHPSSQHWPLIYCSDTVRQLFTQVQVYNE